MENAIITNNGIIIQNISSPDTEILYRLKRKNPHSRRHELEKYQYYEIRDLAWHILLDCNINTLPVSLNQIVKYYGISVLSYQKDTAILDILDKNRIRDKNEAYCGHVDNAGLRYICYDENYPATRIRFSIAHEIAHLIREHRNELSKIDEIETEADMIAARLLMPIGVLHACNVVCANEIAVICNVSLQSAEYRFKRYKELLQRNKFYSSPLETSVTKNFKSFIDRYNSDPDTLRSIPYLNPNTLNFHPDNAKRYIKQVKKDLLRLYPLDK